MASRKSNLFLVGFFTFGSIFLGLQCSGESDFRCKLDTNCPGSNQWCHNGLCLHSDCPNASCPSGTVCVDYSFCVERNCVDIACPEQQRCANGKCWKANCSNQTCEADQVCENETCVDILCVEGRCPCIPTEPEGEMTCNDGVDNDCDSLTDCADAQCEGKPCNDHNPATENDTCVAGECVGACNPSEPDKELSCADGQDNDCDGKTDCQDEDCDGKECDDLDPATHSTVCVEKKCIGECEPSEPGQELTCNDGSDNDCDEKRDCEDEDCDGKPCDTSNPAKVCMEGSCKEPEPMCVPDESPSELSCNDNKDNDCDGKTDCEDENCAGKPCDTGNPAKVCQGGLCKVPDVVCTPDESPNELSCNDGKDNDCDGKTDCEDSDCTGKTRPCGLCDKGTETCQANGTWSSCQMPADVCSPSATQGCGNCGTSTCQSNCQWGSCDNQGVCSPSQTSGCGWCGTSTCQSNCQWGSCEGQGRCNPGSSWGCGNCGTCTCQSDCDTITLSCQGGTQACSFVRDCPGPPGQYQSCTGVKYCVSSGGVCNWGSCVNYTCGACYL